MAESKTDLIEMTHRQSVFYKARNGEAKELIVVMPLEPGKQKLDFKDIQLLAKEIAKVLAEDAF
jgi:hypothetical protein